MKVKEFYADNWAKDIPLAEMAKYGVIAGLLERENLSDILDIGCGEGDLGVLIRQRLPQVKVAGIDISQKAADKASKRGIDGRCVNVSEERLPFSDSAFDAVICGEVIEHLFDPDHLLDEASRVLKDRGLLIITTPNLASWYNRVALLFGYQPFFTEVSTRNGYGHALPFWLNAGHLRLFTLKALKEILVSHGFKIEAVRGFGINTGLGFGKRFSWIVKFMNFILTPFPALASNIMVVCKK